MNILYPLISLDKLCFYSNQQFNDDLLKYLSNIAIIYCYANLKKKK